MIVLSQRPDDVHRIRVLERGGDDIIAKPFSYPELRARVAAVLRRAECRHHHRQLRVASLTIDLGARHVRVGADPVELSAKEYELLVALANDPHRVFTRQELLRDVWGYRTPSSTVDSHACRLRQKLSASSRPARDQRLGHRLPPLRPTGRPAANRDTEHTMSRRDPHPALATQPTCRQRPSSTATEPDPLALEISHAHRLRRKLCADSHHRLVINVWGVGYRLIDGGLHRTQPQDPRSDERPGRDAAQRRRALPAARRRAGRRGASRARARAAPSKGCSPTAPPRSRTPRARCCTRRPRSSRSKGRCLGLFAEQAGALLAVAARFEEAADLTRARQSQLTPKGGTDERTRDRELPRRRRCAPRARRPPDRRRRLARARRRRRRARRRTSSTRSPATTTAVRRPRRSPATT